MARGVLNNHKSDIIVTLPEDGGELKLVPGVNSITSEQYRGLRAVKVIENYFSIKLLEDTKLPEPPAPAEPGDQGTGAAAQSKPLDRMNKEELVAKATELNLEVLPEDTKATLVAKIQAALAA